MATELTHEFLNRVLPQGQRAQVTGAFSRLETDSRKITPSGNELFAAIPGDQFDGHDFIEKALESGAKAVICERNSHLPEHLKSRCYLVPNVIQALRTLGKEWRKQFQIPLIAVAGSVGKTTTKEILAACLSGRAQGNPDSILKTKGSENGFLGIPITLLKLRDHHAFAVIEIGIDEPGAMEKHIDIVNPDFSVLTAIGPEHLEKLIDIETVAHEEALALILTAQHGGKVAINLDDSWISPLYSRISGGQSYAFTLDGKAQPNDQILVGKTSAQDTQLKLDGMGFNGQSLTLSLPGKHNVRNLLAAVTLSKALGLSFDEIQSGLASFKNEYGRTDLQTLKNGAVVLCDYYNANPTSTEAAILLLNQIHQRAADHGKKWLCLADMLEMGEHEEQIHRGLAHPILENHFEGVLLTGNRMKWLHDQLQDEGFKGELHWFSDKSELGKFLKSRLQSGDHVLIKGSRGMRMEEAWKIISS